MKKFVSVLLVSAMTILMAMPVMADPGAGTYNGSGSTPGSAEVEVTTKDASGNSTQNKYIVVLPATINLETVDGQNYSKKFDITVKGRIEKTKYVELEVVDSAGNPNSNEFTLTPAGGGAAVTGHATLAGSKYARSDSGISDANDLNVATTNNEVTAEIHDDGDYTGQLYFKFTLK